MDGYRAECRPKMTSSAGFIAYEEMLAPVMVHRVPVWKVVQMKGPCNGHPPSFALEASAKFLKAMGGKQIQP